MDGFKEIELRGKEEKGGKKKTPNLCARSGVFGLTKF